MSLSAIFTFLFALALMGLSVSLFLAAYRESAPPGDRSRRGRRMLGATLLELCGVGLCWWALVDAEAQPLLFLNLSAVLLLLVVALVVLALADWGAVVRAERHRKLSLLTQELYGFPLRELPDGEAERVGRKAIERMLRERAGKDGREAGV